MKNTTLGTAVLVLGLCASAPAMAGDCEGVHLADTTTVGGTTLVLNGMGVREATVFNVNVYVAGLYVEHRSGSGPGIVFSNEKKKLVLHFVHNVSHSQMADAFEEGFRSHSNGGYAAIEARVHQLQGWIPGLHEGNELVFTYTPGTGIEVAVDGAVRGTIAGDDFAHAFFAIWLGANPPNAGLQTGMLGGHCG